MKNERTSNPAHETREVGLNPERREEKPQIESDKEKSINLTNSERQMINWALAVYIDQIENLSEDEEAEITALMKKIENL